MNGFSYGSLTVMILALAFVMWIAMAQADKAVFTGQRTMPKPMYFFIAVAIAITVDMIIFVL